jgi:peptide/nickel transport system ATP-binding protein
LSANPAVASRRSRNIVTSQERATSGEIRMARQNIATLEASRQSRHLLQPIPMIFQNPDTTLNPSHTAGFSIRGSLKKFGISKGRAKINARMREILEMVRLPADFARRKPNELSGGQKQRIAIAQAFAANPSLIVADEPVSALDVSVHAAVVTLLLACANLMRPPLKTPAARVPGADP